MLIEIHLKGFNGFGWKVCNKCPLLVEYEWGDACALDYAGNSTNMHFGWINTINGNFVKVNKQNPNYHHVAEIERVIVRPQQCIDKHGR
jgi:hypothetical protein